MLLLEDTPSLAVSIVPFFMQVTVLTNVALSFESKHFWLDFHCFYINLSVFDAAQSICMLVFSDLWL